MDLNELRNEINTIDDEILSLFQRRMEVAGQVADYKRANGLPTYQPAREREILKKCRSRPVRSWAAMPGSCFPC